MAGGNHEQWVRGRERIRFAFVLYDIGVLGYGTIGGWEWDSSSTIMGFGDSLLEKGERVSKIMAFRS